jgi:hypothetical protein
VSRNVGGRLVTGVVRIDRYVLDVRMTGGIENILPQITGLHRLDEGDVILDCLDTGVLDLSVMLGLIDKAVIKSVCQHGELGIELVTERLREAWPVGRTTPVDLIH